MPVACEGKNLWNGKRNPVTLVNTIEAKKRSEEHTSELQSRLHLVCRLLLEKKKINKQRSTGVRSNKPRERVHISDLRRWEGTALNRLVAEQTAHIAHCRYLRVWLVGDRLRI